MKIIMKSWSPVTYSSWQMMLGNRALASVILRSSSPKSWPSASILPSETDVSLTG